MILNNQHDHAHPATTLAWRHSGTGVQELFSFNLSLSAVFHFFYLPDSH
jgi:hypothetical protein